MSKWTETIDADVSWASAQLGPNATPEQILDLLARQRGRAYASQEIQSSMKRIKSQPVSRTPKS